MCALNFRCNVPMQDRVRADVSDGVSWYCPQCYTRKSIREGSFFSKSKITLQKWMIILHFWVHQYPVTDVMLEADVDKHTAIDAYQWFREICSSSLLLGPQIVLGGPGVVVHIDESLFRHKPKVYMHLCTLCRSIIILYISLCILEQPRPSYNTRNLGFWDG